MKISDDVIKTLVIVMFFVGFGYFILDGIGIWDKIVNSVFSNDEVTVEEELVKPEKNETINKEKIMSQDEIDFYTKMAKEEGKLEGSKYADKMNCDFSIDKLHEYINSLSEGENVFSETYSNAFYNEFYVTMGHKCSGTY